jgi:Flp pilus assembly pilin Flp
MRDFVIVSLKRLVQDRRGISALEYGVLAAVVVVAVAVFANGFSGIFSTVTTKITTAVGT